MDGMNEQREEHWFVTIVETETQRVEKRMGPMPERRAERVADGVGRNLDHEHFYVTLEKGGA